MAIAFVGGYGGRMTMQTARRVSKNTVARLLNALMFLCGCFVAGTGWLLDERLPRGRNEGGVRPTLLGMNRHDWGAWHAWVGFALVALVGVHLAMHGRWLVKIAAEQKPWRLVAGLAVGSAVVAFFLFAPVKG